MERGFKTWLRGVRLSHIAVLYFGVLQVVILYALFGEEWSRPLIFWYCNNIPLFFAVAFYERNLQLAKGLSYVGLLTQLLWASDFIGHLFGFDLANTANYVFVEGFTFANDVSVIAHMTVPFIVLALTLRTRPQPYSLLYSIMYIIGLWVATVAGTSLVDDVNCVWNACSSYLFPYHVLLWPLYMIALSLAGYAVHEGLYRLYARYRHTDEK